jgi:hypothetical protein
MRSRNFSVLFAVAALGCAVRDTHQLSLKRPSFDAVTMQRSGCYGPCPVYTVEISYNGKVTFKGERFVVFAGEHLGSTRPADLARLDQAIVDIGFFSLREQYQSGEDGCTTWATDNATVSILVSTASRQHQVTYYYGCEIDLGPSIARLSQTIDEVAHARRWVGHGAL